MKLTKDQIQKSVLGAMLFCGIIYSYGEFLLGPLSAAREQAVKDAAELVPKIAAARAQIAKTKEVEKKAPASQTLLEQVKAMIPQGSPIAWVPTKITELFRREGVEKSAARMLGEVSEKEISGFAKYAWAVEVPRAEFITFAKALSALENEEPLMEVQFLDIEAGRENVQFQRMTITLHNIVRL
jgi:predicted Holliday junction resolvase-like endonuclease